MTSPTLDSPEPVPFLPSIHSPEDVKKVPLDKLPLLAQEIRNTLISTLSETGGHLGPNLGVVELTIALHRVFSTPEDKILFDVSHQAYVHKMLTGRADRINTIRQFGGLNGFMLRTESPHDAYGAGHAGTALSAALGLASARDLKGGKENVIAVAGDGAFTCGPTLEALNNISDTTRRLIVVLNDNEWSIDKNVGALARYFNALQTSETYSWLRKKASDFASHLGGTMAQQLARKVESSAKGMLFPSMLFDKFGVRYFGPLDGHNIPLLIRTFEFLKTLDEPVLLHIITEKGRGFAPAVENPMKFHGLGKYSVEDGSTPHPELPSYSEVFAHTVTRFADTDDKVTAITAAMPGGTMLEIFKKEHPERYYDVGIAEEHAAIFACGQAAMGYKPYLAIYSTFMQRAVDMIFHDAALQSLPVRFCMDRAGLSGDDGPTHHGLFDIGMLRHIPNLVFMQPKDEAELVNMLYTMNSINDQTSVIRYPRGVGSGASLPESPELLPIGRAEIVREGTDVAFFALGNLYELAEKTREILEAEGISVALVNPRFIKPLDTECVCRFAEKCRLIVTFEDHVVSNGFGSAVMECLNDARKTTSVLRIGWPDCFIEHGTVSLLRQKHGLVPDVVAEKVRREWQDLA